MENYSTMKNINSLSLFDDHFLMERLTKLGGPLQKLNEYIDWRIFERPLNEAFTNEDKDLTKGLSRHSSRLSTSSLISILTSLKSIFGVQQRIL